MTSVGSSADMNPLGASNTVALGIGDNNGGDDDKDDDDDDNDSTLLLTPSGITLSTRFIDG
ncbi:hypothetical protein D3C80_1950730 [compost metagenome]